jgi:hypothetical protein
MLKKLLSIMIVLLMIRHAYAEDWLVVETGKTYQIKILQPFEKQNDKIIVWQKLLLYNRMWFKAKVVWNCEAKTHKTLLVITAYRDDPPLIDSDEKAERKVMQSDRSAKLIYDIVCK